MGAPQKHAIEALPTHLGEDDVEALLHMVTGQTPDHDICEAMDITTAQLDAIRQDGVFRARLGGFKTPMVVDQVRREATWDELETAALAKAIDTLDAVDGPEAATRIATAANKASRRYRENSGKRVPGALPNTPSNLENGVLIPGDDTGNQLLARFQNLLAREAAILNSAPTKAADVCSVETIENFMTGKPSEPEDVEAEDGDKNDG